jgi:hypothetical protein
MAQPDIKGQIVTGPLRDVSIAYRNRAYVADRVFPIIDNCPPQAKIAKYLKGAWFRDEAGVRGPGGRAKRGGYPTSFETISTKEYAFAKEVTDEDRRFSALAFAPPLKPDQDAIEFCSDKIDMAKERRVSALIRAQTWVDGASGGTDAAGAWAPGAGNTFVANMRTGIAAVKAACGLRPNTLLLDFKTYQGLCEESTVLSKIMYTQRAVLTTDILASIFDLKEVLIGDAVYSSANELKTGLDFTTVQIWEANAGKGMAFLFYKPDVPGLKTPSAGYIARVPYDGGAPRRVETWRENAEHQDVYEVAEEIDIVATGLDCGYLWKDTFLT